MPHKRLLVTFVCCGIRGTDNFPLRSHSPACNRGRKLSHSVLGSPLFLVYFNERRDGVSVRLRLFADGSVLYVHIKTPSDAYDLQEDLHEEKNKTKTRNLTSYSLNNRRRKSLLLSTPTSIHSDSSQGQTSRLGSCKGNQNEHV